MSFFPFILNFSKLFPSSKRQKQQLKGVLLIFLAVLKIIQKSQEDPCFEVLAYLNALNCVVLHPGNLFCREPPSKCTAKFILLLFSGFFHLKPRHSSQNAREQCWDVFGISTSCRARH